MKKLFLFFFFLFFLTIPVFADDLGEDEFFLGEVQKVLEVNEEGDFGSSEFLQVQLSNGEMVEIEAGDLFTESASRGFEEGDLLVARKGEFENYSFVERYRLSGFWVLGIAFFFLIFLTTGIRGFFALSGLFIGIIGIFSVLIPLFVHGGNVYLYGISGILLLGGITMLLAHGFRRVTYVALLGTAISLLFAFVLSFLFVHLMYLFGVGSDTALQLQLSGAVDIDFRGILLIGILLGTLGVLDDVTAAQVVAIEELKKANPSADFRELFTGGYAVGKEHLLSMINTLVFAYAGVALPLLLLFSIGNVPTWILLNSEVITEEIVRTVVGSMAILFAIPITTALGAWWFGRKATSN